MPELIKILMSLGQMRTATQSLPDDEVEVIGADGRPLATAWASFDHFLSR